MAKGTLTEDAARAAAERIARARETGEQLSLLPADPVEAAEADAASGRAPRGPGKAMSQMREWLAARGYKMPEDVLAEMAGLSSDQDAVLTAMANAERILAWAFDGAEIPKGGAKAPTAHMRLETFKGLYAQQLRAAEALMPYGLGKVTADVKVEQNTVFLVASGRRQGADPAAGARDVTPAGPRRMAPPPMPQETKRNQGVAEAVPARSDGEARTE